MRWEARLATAVALAAGGVAPAAGAPPSADDRVVAQLMGAYVAAWDRADAAAIAQAFAPDGDFINPGGTYAHGRAAVKAFYRAAFDRGYAQSHGSFTPRITRRLAPGVLAVDGEWSIEAAHNPDGSARPREAGLATAVLVRRGAGWAVALLREQASATRIAP